MEFVSPFLFDRQTQVWSQFRAAVLRHARQGALIHGIRNTSLAYTCLARDLEASLLFLLSDSGRVSRELCQLMARLTIWETGSRWHWCGQQLIRS